MKLQFKWPVLLMCLKPSQAQPFAFLRNICNNAAGGGNEPDDPDGPGSAGERGNFTKLGQSIEISGFSQTAKMGPFGNTVFVGEPSYNDGVGRVRVLLLGDNGNWTQVGMDLEPGGTDAYSLMGSSIAVDKYGFTIIVGAPEFNTNYGFVTTFGLDVKTDEWIEQFEYIQGPEESMFGASVAMVSTEGVAIGAPMYNSSMGFVAVYGRDNGWVQWGDRIYGMAEGDGFGNAVAVGEGDERGSNGLNAGDHVVVASGAAGTSEFATIADEYVKVFSVWANGTQDQMGETIMGPGNTQFGFSLDLNQVGHRVVIGAPGFDGNGTKVGLVQVYEYDEGSWSQLGSDIVGEVDSGNFGYSVSFSTSSVIAVGARGFFDSRVRIFRYSPETEDWEQAGVDIVAEQNTDRFGSSVSLSGDGTRVSIGVPMAFEVQVWEQEFV